MVGENAPPRRTDLIVSVFDGSTRAATMNAVAHFVAMWLLWNAGATMNWMDTFVVRFVEKTKSPRMSGVNHLDDLVVSEEVREASMR